MRKRVDGRRWADERSGSAGRGQEWDRKCVTDGRMDGWMDKRRMMGRKGDKEQVRGRGTAMNRQVREDWTGVQEVSQEGKCTLLRGLQSLTRHWMSPRKSSLWAMSTRFQATAKRSSSRYAEASELPHAGREGEVGAGDMTHHIKWRSTQGKGRTSGGCPPRGRVGTSGECPPRGKVGTSGRCPLGVSSSIN